MRVKVTVTDDNGQTESYEGTSADDFDCWEAGFSNSRLNSDASSVLDVMLSAAHNHVTGKP